MSEVPVIERFRKRPLEVEMMLWDGTHERLAAIQRWTGNLGDDPTASPRFVVDAERNGAIFNEQEHSWINVPRGHRIAKSTLGEFYPVSPAAIAETFDPAPEPLELTEVERVAVEHTEHMSTCHEPTCVDCMKELRAIRRTIKAVEPVIEEQVGREVDAFYVRALCEFIYEHADTDEGAEDGLQFSVRELAELVNGWQLDAWELYLREREPARFADTAALEPAAAGEPEAVTQG